MIRDSSLRRVLLQRLNRFDRRAANPQGLTRAAVALLVVDEGHGAFLDGIREPDSWSPSAALMLTRRSTNLRKHAGQWALPGGRLDEGESENDAALRETEEEVGVQLTANNILGWLDDFVTRSGFIMTPVVVWAGAAKSVDANEREVSSIHRIPVSEFLRPDAPILDDVEHGEHPVLRMPVGTDSIAAPTAAVLYQFAEVCLRDRPTRVSHFEQPEFAWR